MVERVSIVHMLIRVGVGVRVRVRVNNICTFFRPSGDEAKEDEERYEKSVRPHDDEAVNGAKPEIRDREWLDPECN